MIKILKTFGPGYRTEGTDVLALKSAFARLGYYHVPDYGMTPCPDMGLVRAVLDFQEAEGLKKDGVVKPDGETLARLNSVGPELATRSPTMWCTQCGGPRGGSKGDLCPPCAAKS